MARIWYSTSHSCNTKIRKMMSEAKKTAFTLTSAVHFDDRTALHLTQAFNQESDIASLLALLFSQLQALCGAHGLIYVNDVLELECRLGKTAHHNAEYNLEYAGEDLGKLTIYFPRPQNEAELQTCEDLLALMFTALKNTVALTLAQQNAAPALIPSDEKEELSKDEKADALILLALDGYAEMVRQASEEWAQILMTSVHTQVKEGLRQADGVYQISDELIAILLPNTSQDQAHAVAEKVRVLVASLHLTGATDGQLTASMGIADAKLAKTAEDVMANAKIALAAARNSGRSSIQLYDASLRAD